MNNLIVFQFESQEIRFVDGKPVANDVAMALGYADPSKTISTKVDCEYKGVTKMVTPGGIQSVAVLEEPGVYQLIFGSKLPSAKQFQKWVFEEVLPQIRKTGKYSTQSDENPRTAPSTEARKIAFDIRDIRDAMGEEDPRLAQFLIDHAISGIMEQKQLAGVRYRGVVEIAEEMGFKVDHHNRSQLGKFVKSMLPEAVKQEERLVNGSFRKVCCYPDTEEVRAVISKYFN